MSITLPSDIDAEVEVLSAVLVDPASLPRVRNTLTADQFYLPRHQDIFRGMTALEARGEAIDVVTLRGQLQRDKTWERAGGMVTLTAFLNRMGSVAHLEHYCRLVADKARTRAIIEACRATELEALRGEDSPDEIVATVLSRFREIDSGGTTDARALEDFIPGVFDELESPPEIRGVQTGISALDEVLLVMPQQPVLIMGRPSHGKSSLAANIVANNAARGTKFFVEICEGTVREWILRMTASRAGVPYRMVIEHLQQHAYERPGRHALSPHNLSRIIHALDEVKASVGQTVFLHESTRATAAEIIARAGRLNDRVGLDALVVDHFHEMRHEGGDQGRRDLALKDSLTRFKWAAQELELTPIILGQVNRGVESRSKWEKLPIPADFRDCGAAEEVAAIVMTVMHPWVYGLTEWSDGTSMHRHDGLRWAVVNVAKNRFGERKAVRLLWDGPAMTWRSP